MAISNFFRGWLFLLLLIPSVPVSIFNLYHLLANRALRTALNNHVIIALLCFGLLEALTDIVWTIHFYLTGVALSSTPAFCLIWVYCDSAVYISVYTLMAWASIERHILVFYPNLYRTKTKRLYFHYIPIVLCIIYPSAFYLVTFFIIPCDLPFRYNVRICARFACISRFPWLSLWSSIGYYIAPAFITVIFSMALFIRVLYRRYRVRGQIEWRNYKKLTAQLLPISFLYMALQLPPMTLYAAYAAGVSPSIGSDYYSDGFYFAYWIVLLTPLASIVSLPDLKGKCCRLLFWRRNRAVRPAVINMTTHSDNQPAVVVKTTYNVKQPQAMEMTLHNVSQRVVNGVIPHNINQSGEIKMAPPNTDQWAETEVAQKNGYQPKEIEVVSNEANQGEPNEMVYQNVPPPFGSLMVHHYLDQSFSALPGVE